MTKKVRNHSVRFITEATLVLVFSSDTSIALDNLVYIDVTPSTSLVVSDLKNRLSAFEFLHVPLIRQKFLVIETICASNDFATNNQLQAQIGPFAATNEKIDELPSHCELRWCQRTDGIVTLEIGVH